MPIPIIREREYVEEHFVSLTFQHDGAGFDFDLIEIEPNVFQFNNIHYDAWQGGEHFGKINECSTQSFVDCLDGRHPHLEADLMRYTNGYWREALGRCQCGCEVVLRRFTNTCECGRDYNSRGQLLAPREQWGEETGEHWTECY